MTPAEDIVSSTTRAIAETVRDVRPLRLSPIPGELVSAPEFAGSGAPAAPGARAGRTRRSRAWVAPIAAAAAVIALAVSLVAVRATSDGHGIPATHHMAADGRVPPPYYVTLDPLGVNASSRKALQVRDTYTGATLATLAPPKGSTFFGATAAADDRTFIVDTLPFGRNFNPSAPRTWYLLRIATGTRHPARLARLPIPKLADVTSIAVSRSGSELAVATGGGRFGLDGSVPGTFVPNAPGVLRIYSVATGKLLRTWTTTDNTVFGFGPTLTSENNTILSWVNGDRALAFSSTYPTGVNPQDYTFYLSVRMLNVSARGGDLLADSRVVWAQEHSARSVGNPYDCAWGTNPLISPDGKTVVCASIWPVGGAPLAAATKTLRWLAWPTSGSAPTSAGRVLYQVTVTKPTGTNFFIDTMLDGPSGGTVLAAWGLYRGEPSLMITPTTVHFGAISGGRFTPLPPPAFMILLPPYIPA